jgi:hypothetical protein
MFRAASYNPKRQGPTMQGALRVTDAEALPAAPVQVSVYLMDSPSGVPGTTSDPLVGSEPDQLLTFGLADAVQDVAFVLDQVSVTDPRGAVGGPVDAEMVTVTCDGFPAMLIV